MAPRALNTSIPATISSIFVAGSFILTGPATLEGSDVAGRKMRCEERPDQAGQDGRMKDRGGHVVTPVRSEAGAKSGRTYYFYLKISGTNSLR